MNYPRRKAKSRGAILGAIIAAILLISVAIVESRGISVIETTTIQSPFDFTADKAKASPSYTIADSLTSLEKWSEELLDLEHTDVMWTLRWDMNLTNQSMEKLAQQLYVDEYNTAVNKVISQGGTHIAGAIPQHDGKLVLQQVVNEGGEVKVTVLLQMKHEPIKKKTLKKYVTFADEIISTYGREVTHSAKITGTMQDDALKRIKSVTNSTLVEEYKDESMKVVTAYSPNLQKSYWLTSNKMINLQYAVYFDKNTKDSILTLAIPLISGEFGDIPKN